MEKKIDCVLEEFVTVRDRLRKREKREAEIGMKLGNIFFTTDAAR